MGLETLGRLVDLVRFRGARHDAKVVLGKDGVLFLDNDTNRVMNQITGRTKLSERTLSAIHQIHAERSSICSALDIAYRHVVCPNKESIEIDHLPEKYRFESEGPTVMSQYLRRYALEGPFYDRAVLQRMDAPYYKTDSHWTQTGALTYFRAALSQFDDCQVVERLDALRVESFEHDRVGDLGMKLDNMPERCVLLHLPDRSARIVFEASMTGDGHVRLERSSETAIAGTRALVFHDSFTEPLYLFLAECYAETLFVWTPHFDAAFVARYDPDVVWFLQAERFFPRVPRNGIDLPAWIAIQEKRKSCPVHGSAFMQDLGRVAAGTTPVFARL